MKQAIIFGLTQFSEILAHYLRAEAEYNIAAYTADAAYIGGGGGLRPLWRLRQLSRITLPRNTACLSVWDITI